MPPIDETFANYLAAGEASALKALALPSIPLKMTSHLNGWVGLGLPYTRCLRYRHTKPTCWRIWIRARVSPRCSGRAVPHHRSGSSGNQTNCCLDWKVDGSDGGEKVVEKLRDAKVRSAAFKSCIPLRSESTPRTSDLWGLDRWWFFLIKRNASEGLELGLVVSAPFSRFWVVGLHSKNRI